MLYFMTEYSTYLLIYCNRITQGLVSMVDPDPLLATPSETARFIAAAHTVFNILLALAIIPISGRFAGLVRRVSRRGALLPR